MSSLLTLTVRCGSHVVDVTADFDARASDVATAVWKHVNPVLSKQDKRVSDESMISVSSPTSPVLYYGGQALAGHTRLCHVASLAGHHGRLPVVPSRGANASPVISVTHSSNPTPSTSLLLEVQQPLSSSVLPSSYRKRSRDVNSRRLRSSVFLDRMSFAGEDTSAAATLINVDTEECSGPSATVSSSFVSFPLVVGNATWWLGPSAAAERSHRWTIYVRGLQNEDLSPIVESVTFTLHDTFPNHIRTVTEAPFELTEHGWGEFLVGLSIKFMDVSLPVDVTHLLQFSLRPRAMHSIPPSGRPFVREDVTPYTLSSVPCVHECLDEFVVQRPSAVFRARLATMQSAALTVPRSSAGGIAAALHHTHKGGVTCWDEIRKYGPKYAQMPTAASLASAAPDDMANLLPLRNALRQAVAQLADDVTPILLGSLRLAS